MRGELSEAMLEALQQLVDAGGQMDVRNVALARALVDEMLAFPLMNRHGHWIRITPEGRAALRTRAPAPGSAAP